jgi:hypothetical protein
MNRFLFALLLLSVPAFAATTPVRVPDVLNSGTLSAACADASINACPANSTVKVALAGAAGCGIAIPTSTTLVGTLVGDYSLDGNIWVGSVLVDYSGNAVSSSTAASGSPVSLGVALVGGAGFCRVRSATVTSGSATATIIATVTPSIGNAVQGMGSAGSPSAGVMSVQGITGGTPVSVTVQNQIVSATSVVVGTQTSGAQTPIRAEGNNFDGESPTPIASGTAILATEAYNKVYDPAAGVWDRQRGSAASGTMVFIPQPVTVSSTAPLGVAIISGGGASYATGTPTDAFTNPPSAQLNQSFNMGWNGVTWERTGSGGTNIDTEAVGTVGSLDTEAHGMVFNGATWDRMRGSSSTGITVSPVTTAAATTAGTCTAVTTSAALLAARTNRIGSLVTSISTNTVRARYSFGATATNAQMPLEPGQSLSLDATYKGAVSFISETGASITICVVDW